jgi:hypothetical protein
MKIWQFMTCLLVSRGSLVPSLTSEVLLNSMRYQIFFSLWRAMSSGRALRKCSFALICLVFRGSCAVSTVALW